VEWRYAAALNTCLVYCGRHLELLCILTCSEQAWRGDVVVQKFDATHAANDEAGHGFPAVFITATR